MGVINTDSGRSIDDPRSTAEACKSVEDVSSICSPSIVAVPSNEELLITSFKADAACAQYCFREGQQGMTHRRVSRPTACLKMPWFRDRAAVLEVSGGTQDVQYRSWLLSNIALRGCYVVEPYCCESRCVQAAIEVIRGDFRRYQEEWLETGKINEADITEGMNLCPLYDDDVEAAAVQEFILAVEQHLEAIRSPSVWASYSSSPCEPKQKREAMFISYRTRGIGTGESYLNHWHTDFDAYDVGKDAHNRGEEVLEEFFVKHLPFMSLQLSKKFAEQGVSVPGFPSDEECRRMKRWVAFPIWKEALCVSDLARILHEYHQDVNNIWFTLRTEKRPCSGLCVQTNAILVDEEHDYRIMDEFVEDEVPTLLDSDMLTAVNGDNGGEVAVVFGSMRYTHRSCKFVYSGDDVQTQRRNNMEARFLLLDEGGLIAIAQWVARVKHHYL